MEHARHDEGQQRRTPSGFVAAGILETKPCFTPVRGRGSGAPFRSARPVCHLRLVQVRTFPPKTLPGHFTDR